MILACTIFDRSTHVMDRQMDGQTELRWLRCAEAVAAFVHKKFVINEPDEVHRRSKAAIQQLAAPVATSTPSTL